MDNTQNKVSKSLSILPPPSHGKWSLSTLDGENRLKNISILLSVIMMGWVESAQVSLVF